MSGFINLGSLHALSQAAISLAAPINDETTSLVTRHAQVGKQCTLRGAEGSER
jgi:hypothetical protein